MFIAHCTSCDKVAVQASEAEDALRLHNNKQHWRFLLLKAWPNGFGNLVLVLLMKRQTKMTMTTIWT